MYKNDLGFCGRWGGRRNVSLLQVGIDCGTADFDGKKQFI